MVNSTAKFFTISLQDASSAEKIRQLSWKKNKNLAPELIHESSSSKIYLNDLIKIVYDGFLKYRESNGLPNSSDLAKRILTPIWLKLVELCDERRKQDRSIWFIVKDFLTDQESKLKEMESWIGPDYISYYQLKINFLDKLDQELSKDGPSSLILKKLGERDVSALSCVSKNYYERIKFITPDKSINFKKILLCESLENSNLAEKFLNEDFLEIYLMNKPQIIWEQFLIKGSDLQLAELLIKNPGFGKKCTHEFKKLNINRILRAKNLIDKDWSSHLTIKSSKEYHIFKRSFYEVFHQYEFEIYMEDMLEVNNAISKMMDLFANEQFQIDYEL